jgi:hypothetical protein
MLAALFKAPLVELLPFTTTLKEAASSLMRVLVHGPTRKGRPPPGTAAYSTCRAGRLAGRLILTQSCLFKPPIIALREVHSP